MDYRIYEVGGQRVTFCDGLLICQCDEYKKSKRHWCEHVRLVATERRLGQVLAATRKTQRQ